MDPQRVTRDRTEAKMKSPLCLSPLNKTPKVAAKEKEKQRGCADDSREEKKKTGRKNNIEKKPSMDINESAEAFINKFKQQLLIQRLESIENYEQMLARGT